MAHVHGVDCGFGVKCELGETVEILRREERHAGWDAAYQEFCRTVEKHRIAAEHRIATIPEYERDVHAQLADAQREYDEVNERFRALKQAAGNPFWGGVPTSLAQASKRLADVKRRIAEEQQRENR